MAAANIVDDPITVTQWRTIDEYTEWDRNEYKLGHRSNIRIDEKHVVDIYYIWTGYRRGWWMASYCLILDDAVEESHRPLSIVESKKMAFMVKDIKCRFCYDENGIKRKLH